MSVSELEGLSGFVGLYRSSNKKVSENVYWTLISNILDKSNIINIRNTIGNRNRNQIYFFEFLSSNNLIELTISSNRENKTANLTIPSLLDSSINPNSDLGDFYGIN